MQGMLIPNNSTILYRYMRTTGTWAQTEDNNGILQEWDINRISEINIIIEGPKGNKTPRRSLMKYPNMVSDVEPLMESSATKKLILTPLICSSEYQETIKCMHPRRI